MLRLITPPVQLPVDLDEVTEFLRVTADDEMLTILRMLRAATSLLDARGFLGRCLEQQTWELVLDAFPDGEIALPLGPVASVTSVKYDDLAGVEQTVAAASYDVATADFGGRIVPRPDFAWPATQDAPEAVRVQFVAGTGTPEGVKQALLDMVAAGFETRGGGRMLTPGIVADLAPFRRPVVL